MSDSASSARTPLTATVTTECLCWTLTRTDETVLGFTDHDAPIMLDGVRHDALSGLSQSDLEQAAGLSVDNTEVQGLLTSARISDADIDAGLYDSAQIVLRIVDWRKGAILRTFWRAQIGRITRVGGAFQAELIGQTAALDRSIGRVFSRRCDAQFGDSRCGVDAADFAAGTVCNKTFEQCRAKFQNSANFRGFPYLIGDDAVYAGPQAGQATSGGSRYGR